MSQSQIDPGWYQADGDPPNTQRWWDGAQWVGDPIAQVPPAGAMSPPGAHTAMAGGGPGGGTPRPVADTPIGWARLALSRWSDFSGRACRAEYWWFTLVLGVAYIIVAVVFVALAAISEALAVVSVLVILAFWLGAIIPSLSVTVRRLHDTNKSGWSLLISIIPLIGSILLLVWYATDSDRGSNQYGPPTK